MKPRPHELLIAVLIAGLAWFAFSRDEPRDVRASSAAPGAAGDLADALAEAR